MTAHAVSKINHAWLQADKLCAVIDRAYSGTASTQEIPFLSIQLHRCGMHLRRRLFVRPGHDNQIATSRDSWHGRRAGAALF